MTAHSSFLILHGIANHRPPEHWQFRLAARLKERGHQVLYPALPDPDAPSPALWARCLHQGLGEVEGAERVVVCHSLACLLWFREAAAVAAPVDRLLLVAPPASRCVPDPDAEFRIERFDAGAVCASVRGEIRMVCSDADPYNPEGAQAMYADALGITADILPGAGHITPDSGYGPWPFAEEWCAQPEPAAGLTRPAGCRTPRR
ncbi:MAG: alpha/beta hydrolase [Thermoleophilaceae bacterium]|nr:alpha/beta hydrolase [Thermoleophilaceae bacterium]